MKLLIFTLFLLCGALAQDPPHSEKDPNCEQPSSAEGAEALAAQAKAAAGKTNFSAEFCEAYNACYGAPLSESKCEYAESSYKSALAETTGGSCGLTAEELTTIYFYTGSGYGCLNSYLRNPEGKSPQIETLVKVLDSGLGRLPRYRGFVSRGSELPEKIRELHKQGAEVEYAAYTSTSTGKGFGGTDQFLIYSERGRPIMNFSGIKGENEVLFASRTKFRVITLKSDGQNRYVMREVIGEESDKKKLAEDARVIALAQKQLKDPVKTPPPPPKPKPNWVYNPYPSSMYLTLDANGDKTIYYKAGSGPDIIGGKYLADKTYQAYSNGEPQGNPVIPDDKTDPLSKGLPICGPEAESYVEAQKGEDPSKPKLKCFTNTGNSMGGMGGMYGGGGYVAGGFQGGSSGGGCINCGGSTSLPENKDAPKPEEPKVSWVSHPSSSQIYLVMNENGEKELYTQGMSGGPAKLSAKYLPDNTYQAFQDDQPFGQPAKLAAGLDPMSAGYPICGPGAEKYVAENGGVQPNTKMNCFSDTSIYQNWGTQHQTPADKWKCPTGDEKVPEVMEQINLPTDTAKFFPQEEVKP